MVNLFNSILGELIIQGQTTQEKKKPEANYGPWKEYPYCTAASHTGEKENPGQSPVTEWGIWRVRASSSVKKGTSALKFASLLCEERLNTPSKSKWIRSSKQSSSPRHASIPPPCPTYLDLPLHPSLRASDTPVRPVWGDGPPRAVYFEHSEVQLAPPKAGVKKWK